MYTFCLLSELLARYEDCFYKSRALQESGFYQRDPELRTAPKFRS